jgi:hypothetical protein
LGYNIDQFSGTRISDHGRQNSFIAAVSASSYAGARPRRRLTPASTPG